MNINNFLELEFIIIILLSVVIIINFIIFKRYKILSNKKIQKHKKNIDNIVKEYDIKINNLQNQQKAQTDSLGDQKKTNYQLAKEVSLLREQKESELELRLDAEKRIEITIQKTEDIEKRIENWKMIQDANLKDAITVMNEIGEKIYSNVITHHEKEVKQITNLYENLFAKLGGILNQILDNTSSGEVDSNNIDNLINILSKLKILDYREIVNKILLTLSEKYRIGKNMFNKNLIEEKFKKTILFDLALINNNNLFIIDFTLLNLLQKFVQERNIEALKISLNKHIELISNPKYLNNIFTYFTKVKNININDNLQIIFFLDNYDYGSLISYLDIGEIIESNKLLLGFVAGEYSIKTLIDD